MREALQPWQAEHGATGAGKKLAAGGLGSGMVHGFAFNVFL